jgi:serine/threonine protein kinase
MRRDFRFFSRGIFTLPEKINYTPLDAQKLPPSIAKSMSSRLTNTEPLPGYRLIERLGRGGYGEVWKAEAPGGLHKAIKFVYGDLQEAGEAAQGAEQELKALNRVKTIRHPYVLSIERFDIVEGQLLIVMELADRNLWDRFQECRTQGLTGIPREELLRYLEESAEALDLMNLQHQIQHLDIKPQNLFLVHNHIKVADFGLAKEFEGRRGTMTGGVTPVYAAPETFEGWVSRYSDQYSLAIVFQELLTGIRPFSGTSSRHLLLQHVSADPDVSSLSASDQPIVRRALAKKPDERHPTCSDFIRALKQSGIAPPASPSRVDAQESATRIVEITPEEVSPKTQPRRPGSATTFPPALPSAPELVIDQRTPVGSSIPGSMVKGLPQLRTPQSGFPTPVPGTTPQPTITQKRPTAFNTTQLSKMGIAPPERTGNGVLIPAIVIGIGKIGLTVLQRFRQTIHERLNPGGRLPHLRTLFIDTDPETLSEAVASQPATSFNHSEIIAAKLQRPGHYLKREGMPAVDSWLDPEMLFRIPRTPTTMGLRPLGRLALCDQYPVISQRIRAELESFFREDYLEEADRMTRLGLRSNRPRVYLLTSLTGGTGSGMLVDLAYIVRHEMRQLGYTRPQVTGVLLAPQVDRTTPKSQAIANSLAALVELEHFSRSSTRYESRFETKGNPIIDAERPLHRAVVVTLPKSNDPKGMQQVADFASGIVYQELLTPMGRVADDARQTYQQSHPIEGMSLQTFGMYRLSWPRPHLLQMAVYRFTQRLVDDWLRTDGFSVQEKVGAWVSDQWQRREIDLPYIRRLVEKLTQDEIGQPFAEVLDEKIRSLMPDPTDRHARIDPEVVCKAFDDILKVLGRPGADEETHPSTLTAILDAKCSKLSRELEDRLSGFPAYFIEKPQLRLVAAEECVKILSYRVAQIVDQLERQIRESDAESLDLYKRLFPLIGGLGTTRWAGSRRTIGNEVFELLRAFSLERMQSQQLRATLNIYRSLLNHIPELLRELNHCRTQVKDLKGRMLQGLKREMASPPAYDHPILPAGCQNLKDAVEQFIDSFTAEEMLFFEEEFQGQLARQCKGFLQVALRLGEYFPRFAEIFEFQAREFLDHRLQQATPAEIFFEHRADLQAAQREIHKAFDESAPELIDPRRPGEAQLFILGAPFDSMGDRFRQITRDVLTEVDLVAAASDKDLIFYREQRQVPVSRLPQTGLFAQEAMDSVARQEQCSLFSRKDIDWLPLPRDSVS